MPFPERYRDRAQAGEILAQALKDRAARRPLQDPLVLALPRGGVPVAVPVAQALDAPLDLLFVRKIGAPGQPEFAIAAVVEGAEDAVVTNPEITDGLRVPEGWLEEGRVRAITEIARQRAAYCAGRPRLPVRDRSVIIVDDGVATGTSLFAAIAALHRQNPRDITVCVPVAPPETLVRLREAVDHVICPLAPRLFQAVGFFYDDFHQIEDDEVSAVLARPQRRS
ncbi:phosphoribosyltransferase [Saliniramus sp.]|uniref:phosphoribosyltransferase n=1 Tax=Saliniramus sp. TaxID=2986772 RepID=UPI002C2D4A60|nr:phosphoribosyltransferase family protein [Saliniramus sp.]HMB11074.1 phosphoribosyltransferase family protein [Saliniramus sp.]